LSVCLWNLWNITLAQFRLQPMAEISGKKHGRFCCCAPPISVLSRQVFQIHGLGAGHKLLKNGAGLGNDATKWG
jgi:hypothetical protein